MKLKTVGGVPGNLLGMMADLFHKLQNGVVTPEQLEHFLKKENPFETIQEHLSDAASQLCDWKVFYHEIFGVELDTSFRLPPIRPGFNRLIIIAQGLTAQKIYDKCAEHFPCWKDTNRSLDEAVPNHDRTTQTAYAIWVRDGVEADQEWKNHSANALKERGVHGITLTERLLYELKYFRETGKHLDLKNITLCAGSRDSDGRVPYVRWTFFGRKLYVHWCDPGFAHARLRAREVVS